MDHLLCVYIITCGCTIHCILVSRVHVHVLCSQQICVFNRASGRSQKKSQILRDFQGQIRGKNGRFRGNFAVIFEACLAKKRLVENG